MTHICYDFSRMLKPRRDKIIKTLETLSKNDVTYRELERILDNRRRNVYDIVLICMENGLVERKMYVNKMKIEITDVGRQFLEGVKV